MGYGYLSGRFLVAFTSEFPDRKAIDGGQGIIYCHAEIGIQSGFKIKNDVYQRHDDARKPQPDARPILKNDVNNADNRAQNIKYPELVVGYVCHYFVHFRIA